MRFLMITLLLFLCANVVDAQKLEIEWDGSEEDLLQLIEGGKVRFAIEGHTAGVPDRITFKIKTEPGDSLIDVMSLVEEGFLRLEKDPEAPRDAATKAYVDLLEATIKDIIGAKDIDNNRYETVTIGSQVWMAENLRVAHYNDGVPIPLVTGNAAWLDSSNNHNPAYTWYNNGDYGAPEYGALYNWYAIDSLSNGDKNVCPMGWHVPTDGDWTMLIDELDPAAVDPDVSGTQSLVAGGKMKETGLGHWNGQNIGATNVSGFSGLPGGLRSSGGSFNDIGSFGLWWSSSTHSDANFARNRRLDNSNGSVSRDGNAKGQGFSVRCLRD